MPPVPTIRSCRPEECATVLDLWKRAEVIPSRTDELEELERLAGEHTDSFLVAELDGRIVGTVFANWDGWRGHIYRLAVAPELRRKGIGRALLQEAEARLRAKGARRISVLVAHTDERATSFWNALGNDGYELDARIARYVKTL